jgi:hypothetical protein
MQRCERCARVVPDDEPRCPECGTAPAHLDAPTSTRPAREGRASEPPRVVALGASVPIHIPSSHAPDRRDAATTSDGRLHDARSAQGGASNGDNAPRHDPAEADHGQALAVAAELAPKAAPFAQERTGTQRRESVAWARGGGEGAKIVPLRRTPSDATRTTPGDAHDARRASPEEAPRADARDTPGEVRATPGAPTHDAPAIDAPARDAAAPDLDAPGARRVTPSDPPPDVRRMTPVPRPSETPPRPPVLASESLRADLTPNTPGRSAIRVAAITLGLSGALAAALVGGPGFGTLTIASALALVGALGLAPLAYRGRALALFVVAAPALLSATMLAAPHGGVPHGGLLACTASGLAGALYFRAEYRASRLARALIAAGVAAGALWLVAAGALTGLGAIDAAWQSWLPTLLAAGLAPVLALATLGFMTEDSTGGCSLWASALLVWLACYESAAHAAQVFPTDGGGPADGWHLGAAMGAVATPLLAPVVALALAQLLVSASGGGREDDGVTAP